jgi:hypothetical protein
MEGPMPARSKKQQMAAGAALAAKRGERPKASLKGASREMVDSMSERQLREFASTKAQGTSAQEERMRAPSRALGRPVRRATTGRE